MFFATVSFDQFAKPSRKGLAVIMCQLVQMFNALFFFPHFR